METENLHHADDSDDNNNLPAADSDSEEEDEGVENTPKIPTRELLEEFKKYSEHAAQNTCDLPPDMEAGIKLLSMLSERRVPLNLYDLIFKWHTEHLGAKTHIPIKTLVSRLSTRYNMDDAKPFVKKLELPHSKCRIKLVCHDAKAQIVSLLTDPRFLDEDYLFFNPDNPLEGPPEEWTHVSDINTGRAYRETWKEVIKDPEKEMLLPVMFYMDAAVAGNYDSLPIEAVKMGLGLYNGKTRDLEFAWRPIGYITHFLKEDTQGIDILHETEHMDAEDFMSDSSSDDDEQSDSSSRVSHLPNFGEDDNEQSASSEEEDSASSGGIPACSAQDLHTMLDAILESYRELQNCGGFEWDFRYRGKTYPVTFKPFCIFIKGDSQEHDKHCGSYTSRGQFIQQLCRYCCCKNEDTDNPNKRSKPKTQEMIQKLVTDRDADGLKALSQQMIDNCWYKIEFGKHNKCGVHGACPLETLHWFELGKYKYAREMFFSQTGFSSALGDKINAIAKTVGFCYQRQSVRDLPRTMFSKGIKKGKLQAHEMTGLILVLLTVIRTTKGRNTLLLESKGKQTQYFGSEEKIRDWLMLLETYLQWEAWLNLPEISVFEVERSDNKVRKILALEKQIGQRDTGMKFKTFNFHAATHVANDIMDYGVPQHVNTSSNEMHHKPSKTAALRTQKRPKDFDLQ